MKYTVNNKTYVFDFYYSEEEKSKGLLDHCDCVITESVDGRKKSKIDNNGIQVEDSLAAGNFRDYRFDSSQGRNRFERLYLSKQALAKALSKVEARNVFSKKDREAIFKMFFKERDPKTFFSVDEVADIVAVITAKAYGNALLPQEAKEWVKDAVDNIF